MAGTRGRRAAVVTNRSGLTPEGWGDYIANILVNQPITARLRPWRLSEHRARPLLNDPGAAWPRWTTRCASRRTRHRRRPVLYVKPPATLAARWWNAADRVGRRGDGDRPHRLPRGETRSCRAMAGTTLVADLGAARQLLPSCRCASRRARPVVPDRPELVPASAVPDPAAGAEGLRRRPGHCTNRAAASCSAAPLLQDVSDFMTLHPSDLLLLGVAFKRAPRVRTGSASRWKPPPSATSWKGGWPHEDRARRLRRGHSPELWACGWPTTACSPNQVVWLAPAEPGCVIALGLSFADHVKGTGQGTHRHREGRAAGLLQDRRQAWWATTATAAAGRRRLLLRVRARGDGRRPPRASAISVGEGDGARGRSTICNDYAVRATT